MKRLLFSLIFFCISSCLCAQHYTIPVEQLDSTDLTAFKHVPDTINVDIQEIKIIGVQDSTKRYIVLKVVTNYKEDISGSQFYLEKSTKTTSTIRLPLTSDILNAFSDNNVINEIPLNNILAYFKLKVNHDALVQSQNQ